MKSFKAIITDPVGLHARPAAIIVKTASAFKSDIFIKTGVKEGNLKSIMNIMALGIKTGTEVLIEANGSDAEAAIKAIKKSMQESKLIS